MKEKKKTLRLFMSALVGIFSLATGFTGAFAWFVLKVSQGVDGTEFSVYASDISLSYNIYKYDINLNEPCKIDGETSHGFTLNQYDVVFKERNKYNPVYLEIEISGNLIERAGSFSFILDRDTTAPAMDSNNYLSEYFSSITKYAVGTNGAMQGGIHDSSSVSDTWDNLNAVFYDRDTSGQLTTQLFTSGTSGNYVKTNDLRFTLSYTQSDFVNNSLYVYLYINYDENLSEIYSYEHGLTGQSIGGSSNYTLSNDLTCIRIEENEN